MMYRRIAAVAALVLPSAGHCFDTSYELRETGHGLSAERRAPDGFARAFWSAQSGRNWSLRVAAGPSPALKALTGGDVRPVFPMLTMPLAGRAQLAVIPRSGRSPGAMLAVQFPIF